MGIWGGKEDSLFMDIKLEPLTESNRVCNHCNGAIFHNISWDSLEQNGTQWSLSAMIPQCLFTCSVTLRLDPLKFCVCLKACLSFTYI